MSWLNQIPRKALLAAVVSLWLLPVVVLGCETVSLKGEDEIVHLRALKKSLGSQPRKTVLVPTYDENGGALRIAVHEVGGGSRQRAFVLIHGVFSDHRTWRFVAGDLVKDHDLLLVDLPGCGESDSPEAATLSARGYRLRVLADRVLQALTTRLRSRHLPRELVIAGHSLGGAVILRIAGDPAFREKFPAVFARLKRLVLLAPFDVALHRPDPMFKELVEVPDLVVEIGSWLGIVQNRVANSVLHESGIPGRLPREEVDCFLHQFLDPGRRHANQAILQQAVAWRDERPNWLEIERAEADYSNIDFPALILWGRWDETLPVSMGYKLTTQLPNSILRIVPESKHSLQVERPYVVARAIRQFLEAEDEGGDEFPKVGQVALEPMEAPEIGPANRESTRRRESDSPPDFQSSGVPSLLTAERR